MRKRIPLPIHQVRVASPCDARWESMYGNEVVRHCAECRLNVYNLSAMTRDQAERLIFEAEGRLCVRFYRRKDGTVITQDCPVGLAAFKKRVNRVATAAASAGLAFLAGIGASSLASTLRPRLLDGAGFVDVRGKMEVMGDVTLPPQPGGAIDCVMRESPEPFARPTMGKPRIERASRTRAATTRSRP
jgi:hypothetical protein